MPGVTVTATAGGVVGKGADGGDAIGPFVIVGALGGADDGAWGGGAVSRRGVAVGISGLGVPVSVGVPIWAGVGRVVWVVVGSSALVAVGVAVSVGFGALALVGVTVCVGVAVSVGFGVLALVGVTVSVGVAIGCVAAHDTLPRAHAPSTQVV